jgi:N6-adenosine-specific RNA methylase IME4
MKKYQTIYADPPWKYGVWGKGSKLAEKNKGFTEATNIARPLPYPYMTLKQICNLPVLELADVDCELYLWATQKYLPKAFCVIKYWGFKYCQTLTWCKKPRGTGQGGVYCPTTEFLLLGRRGKMPKVKRVDTTWFLTKRPHNSHSTKPHFFRQLIEGLSNSPRIELFARDRFLGWDVWGNEVKSDIELTEL